MGKQLFLILNSALLWWGSSITTSGARSQNRTDLLALASFKNAIHEDPFGVLSSWNDSTHHCEWQGVLCSKRHPGKVTSLVLTSQGLGGFLSPHIGNLSFLRVITLQNNSFHGEIPSQIGNLFRLHHLTLSNNSFGGPIPSNLSRCLNLKILNLIDNQLVQGIPSDLGSLPRLILLGLSTNSLVGPIPPSIGKLSLLQQLSMGRNMLCGKIPKELSRLERLLFLQLAYNKLTGEIPPLIFNISSIIYFWVSGNQLTGTIPSDIGTTLPSLRDFGAQDNLLTGTIPSSLTNATSLEALGLQNNSFHGPIPKNLGRLKSLRMIGLGFNQLQDDLSFISLVANCSNLEILSVRSNLIHGSLPRSISNLSTRIYGIDMGTNHIQGTIPSALGNVFNLSYLNLECNFLTGRIPDSIGALYSMQRLSFAGNMFTGEIPSSIGNMTSLNLLYLDHNNFKGYIPQSLGNCRQLIVLSLSHNNLIGSVPVEIMGLSSLSIFFSLAHNNLSGFLPVQVGSLKNLGTLDLSYNKLSGLIPASISECFSLEWLYLEANSFQGQIPQALRPLRGLEELDLSNNNFSGPIPSFLAELLLLKYLNMSFNELEGQVPEGGVFLNGSISDLKLPLCKSPSSKKSSLTKAVVIFVVAVSLLCLALLFLSIFYYRKKKQMTTNALTSSSFEHQFLRISYEELLRATNRFSETNVIGKGRYGTVYKGILDGCAMVAVKVLNLMQRGALRSFVSECQTLGIIRHRNLVKILSVCSSVDFCGNDFKALLYEFNANESLEEWLHPRTIGQDDERSKSRNLRLVQRLNIAIDIATAIEYLHKGCYPAIIHGDLKPSNVLLDNDMMARVGDFGLAKIISTVSAEAIGVQDQGNSTSTAVRGSIGYVPPEYGMGHKVSTLGDAYSYGILLLEMFTGKKPTEESFEHHLNLHNFVQMALPDQAMGIADLRLWSEASYRQQEIKIRDCIIFVFEVGVACSMESPLDRMEMTEVIKKLYSIKATYETKERRTEHAQLKNRELRSGKLKILSKRERIRALGKTPACPLPLDILLVTVARSVRLPSYAVFCPCFVVPPPLLVATRRKSSPLQPPREGGDSNSPLSPSHLKKSVTSLLIEELRDYFDQIHSSVASSQGYCVVTRPLLTSGDIANKVHRCVWKVGKPLWLVNLVEVTAVAKEEGVDPPPAYRSVSRVPRDKGGVRYRSITEIAPQSELSHDPSHNELRNPALERLPGTYRARDGSALHRKGSISSNPHVVAKVQQMSAPRSWANVARTALQGYDLDYFTPLKDMKASFLLDPLVIDSAYKAPICSVFGSFPWTSWSTRHQY
ncbi:hypothetical protein BT93_D0955 [Corymbia citriodora subsp. variegata]|nr:hypothetical protein BT93_D0955 [Corymbia citriodora subsp. variegata]